MVAQHSSSSLKGGAERQGKLEDSALQHGATEYIAPGAVPSFVDDSGRADAEQMPAGAPAKVRSSFKGVFWLALLATGLTAAAIYVSKEKTAGTYEHAREQEKTPQFFTDFKDKINNVRQIEMRFRGQDFIVERTDDGTWVMPNRYRYPVDIDKVRDILINASLLQVLERKTNDPEKLALLGLDNPDKADSDAVRVQFFDGHGAALASFIAGKRRRAGGYALYVRRDDETQAYLVKGEGWMRLSPGPNYWLSVDRFRLSDEAIKRVTITHEDAPENAVSITREHANSRSFRLEAKLPEGRKANPTKINETAFAMGKSLSLAGVIPDSKDALADKPHRVSASFVLFSGLIIDVNMFKDKDGDYPARFRARTSKKAGVEAKEAAERFNKAASGWLYLLSGDSAEKLTANAIRLSSVIEDKKNAANKKGAPASGKPRQTDTQERKDASSAPVSASKSVVEHGVVSAKTADSEANIKTRGGADTRPTSASLPKQRHSPDINDQPEMTRIPDETISLPGEE